MQISEMIKSLERAKDSHGDIDIVFVGPDDETPYDANVTTVQNVKNGPGYKKAFTIYWIPF